MTSSMPSVLVPVPAPTGTSPLGAGAVAVLLEDLLDSFFLRPRTWLMPRRRAPGLPPSLALTAPAETAKRTTAGEILMVALLWFDLCYQMIRYGTLGGWIKPLPNEHYGTLGSNCVRFVLRHPDDIFSFRRSSELLPTNHRVLHFVLVVLPQWPSSRKDLFGNNRNSYSVRLNCAYGTFLFPSAHGLHPTWLPWFGDGAANIGSPNWVAKSKRVRSHGWLVPSRYR